MLAMAPKRTSLSTPMVNGLLPSLPPKPLYFSHTRIEPKNLLNMKSSSLVSSLPSLTSHSISALSFSTEPCLHVTCSNNLLLNHLDRFGDLIIHHVIIRIGASAAK